MTWRDLLNVQNVEKGFFRSSNSYGIPDIRKDEFEIKELIPYRVDSRRNGTAHFFLDDYRFERCWKWADSQIPELRKYDGVLSPDFSMYTTYPKSRMLFGTVMHDEIKNQDVVILCEGTKKYRTDKYFKVIDKNENTYIIRMDFLSPND